MPEILKKLQEIEKERKNREDEIRRREEQRRQRHAEKDKRPPLQTQNQMYLTIVISQCKSTN
jgi:Skp family chaperone for outer membrane proteins